MKVNMKLMNIITKVNTAALRIFQKIAELDYSKAESMLQRKLCDRNPARKRVQDKNCFSFAKDEHLR